MKTRASRKHFVQSNADLAEHRTLRRMRAMLFFGLNRNSQIVHSKGHAALSCFLQLWLPMHGYLFQHGAAAIWAVCSAAWPELSAKNLLTFWHVVYFVHKCECLYVGNCTAYTYARLAKYYVVCDSSL